MRSVVPWLLFLGVLPRIEDPWPDTIGLDLPFALATAAVVLAGVVFTVVAHEKRDRAVTLAAAWGFLLGVVFYVIALAAQLVSAL
jgi:hypothetical protein